MNFKNVWYQAGAVFILIIFLASCQNDINSIGAEIFGDDEPIGTLDDSFTVRAYSKKMDPVQSNALRAYQLGVYNHPVYGKSKVNFLTQLTLKSANPKFGDSAVVDSVFVYIPYFSEETKVDSTRTYTLDSVYGNAPINISIFESKYYLRDFDPTTGFEELQAYYSNQGEIFESYLGEELARVEDFQMSRFGYVFPSNNGEEDENEYVAPGLRVKLDSLFFQQKIIDKEGSGELRNTANFKDYFRGLYFKVDSAQDDGSLFLFDEAKGYITVHYSYNDGDTRKPDTFQMNFGGIQVNTFDNNSLPGSIKWDLENADEELGEEQLYLRGGDGIMTVVKLFGDDEDDNGVPEELELLRARKWLINEANLIFYVNQDAQTGGDSEPDRIMIYNLKDNTVLVDYLADPTSGLPANEAVINHLGKLERGSDERGKYYKIKITDHISNLINKDSTNVPLGIVVSQNVNNRLFQKTSTELETDIKKIPASSVMSPKGTILHGNRSPNEEKRLKIQIYYTEPK